METLKKKELMICGYMRNIEKELRMIIPDDIIKEIDAFYMYYIYYDGIFDRNNCSPYIDIKDKHTISGFHCAKLNKPISSDSQAPYRWHVQIEGEIERGEYYIIGIISGQNNDLSRFPNISLEGAYGISAVSGTIFEAEGKIRRDKD